MERFTKIISIEDNCAYNAFGETFFIKKDLLPLNVPCIISYDTNRTSTIIRSEDLFDNGDEWFYHTIVRHANRTFSSLQELNEYKANEVESLQ
jgi:hypothetical protein